MRRWVEKYGVPVKERSLFSQLKGGASFGEKLARRLEADYRMGDRYLDTPDAKPICEGEPKGAAESLGLAAETAAELRLLSVYRLADARERLAIDNVVDEVRIIISDRLAMDKAQR